MRLIDRLATLSAVVAAISTAPPLLAQGLNSATVSGLATTASGRPLQGAVVTLTTVGLDDAGREATTDSSGRFTFGLVAPGAYEVRAEALGYRPVLARTLVVSGGERPQLTLTLAAAPPPVLTVDTVAVAGSSAGRWRPGALRLGPGEIDDLPHRFQDLASVASLASTSDAARGSLGLPGSMTLLVVDGVPVYDAPHPLALGEQLSGPLFPGSALSNLTVLGNATDVEWSGSAGGYLSAASRTATRSGAPELEGAWSGGPLWSSSQLDVPSPSLTSFEGRGRATLVVTPGASQFFVAGDALRQDTPLAERISESVATSLSGLDPALIASLSEPSVERFSRYTGLVRFDSQRGDDGRLFLRAGAGYSKREFDGPGPVTLGRGAALADESLAYSIAGGLLSAYRPGMVLELRGGVSGSMRTFDSGSQDMLSAFLVGPAATLGVVAGGPAESSRTDFTLLPLLHYGMLKLGASARASRHTMRHSVPGDLFFSDAAALMAGQGFARAEDAPEVSFATREVGALAQLDLEPAAGLAVSVGGRLDYEMIPGADATLNTDWLAVSGIRNDDYPSGFMQAALRASFAWDPASNGGTLLSGALALHHGDVDGRVLYELFARDDGATSTSFVGSGLSWPATSLPAGASTLPSITLLGPDTRAPRSALASLGLVQRLHGGWSVRLGGSYRRTDFLMRRRNLNLPLAGRAVDAYGRDVFGTLRQDGSLLTATGLDARRFSTFHEAWALDSDGWSEYRGATVGLEYAGAAASLYVSYTRSETTDNWIGASRARRGGDLPPLLPEADGDWAEGTSDFDVPDRVSAAGSAAVGFATLSAVYRYRSGLPFTPGYRDGVDANGDGAFANDVAFVDSPLVDPLLADWPCLSDQTGRFAVRNSCRGPAQHSVDVRLRLDLGRFAGRDASLVLDGLNLIESEDGVIDDALLLVDPARTVTTSPDGSTVTVPVTANPDFGQVLYPSTRGRMIRVGLRIG